MRGRGAVWACFPPVGGANRCPKVPQVPDHPESPRRLSPNWKYLEVASISHLHLYLPRADRYKPHRAHFQTFLRPSTAHSMSSAHHPKVPVGDRVKVPVRVNAKGHYQLCYAQMVTLSSKSTYQLLRAVTTKTTESPNNNTTCSVL